MKNTILIITMFFAAFISKAQDVPQDNNANSGVLAFVGIGSNMNGIMGKTEVNYRYKNVFAGIYVDGFRGNNITGKESGIHIGYRLKLDHLVFAPSIGYCTWSTTTRQLESVSHTWLFGDVENYKYETKYDNSIPLSFRLYYQPEHGHISFGTDIGTRVENYSSNVYAVIGIYMGVF